MIYQLYYSWVITPETCNSSVASIVDTLLEVLYVSFPHGLDLHMQVLLETSLGSQEFQLIEFDFTQSMSKDETRDLLIKGFEKIVDPKSTHSLTSISKVIVLGYTGENPLVYEV